MGKEIRENLTTLQGHLATRKHLDRHDRAGEGLSGVVMAIALAGKSIAHKVKRARIEDVLGVAGGVNLHGEEQQKLDVIADDLLLHCLSARPDVAVYGSEEQDHPIVCRPRSDGGRFCVLVDPLDGSSNVDVAVSVGTIFSVLENERPDDETGDCVLQRGSRQLAAGYVLYGSQVALVLTTGDGVDLFVLDPTLGEFLLVKERVRIPERKNIYSVNEAYWDTFPEAIRSYLRQAHAEGYGCRYVGSMVADVHRTLLKGGVFLYPATDKAPAGKLRLLYECNPMSFLIEQAGGASATGHERILDIEPEELHQRCPVILGSPGEVDAVTRHFD